MYLSQLYRTNNGRRKPLCQNIPNFYETGEFSDVTLKFFQSGDCAQRKEVVMEIDTHRIVLRACEGEVLNKWFDKCYSDVMKVGNEVRWTIFVELDFELYSKEIVRFFFGLVYYNELTVETLDYKDQAFLHTNVLPLHQLASYFQFQALINLCQEIMYNLFSLENFVELIAYCLSPRYGCPGYYYVNYEKIPLYTKLLHWYQLCTEEARHSPSSLSHCGSGGDVADYHTLTVGKSQMMGENKKYIEKFSNFQLPEINIITEGNTTSIRHHCRMCYQCLVNGRHVFRDDRGVEQSIIDMGYLERDGSRWKFSMTREKNDSSNMYLYMKQQHHDEHMSVESTSSGETIKLRSTVNLFSKQLDDTVVSSDHDIESPSAMIKLAHLKLHDQSHCYESRCDCCQKETKVYIFCIYVDIIR